MRPTPPATRAWQRMLSGRRLDLLDPSPDDIAIADIAHGLARVARWNGQTRGASIFSVAQHSVLVETIAAGIEPALTAAERLAVLLHDGPEYVIGDMISPFKVVLGDAYKAVEARILAAIHARFGLPPSPDLLADIIKRADRIAAFVEAVALAGFSRPEAERILGIPPDLSRFDAIVPEPLPSEAAERQFLDRFAALAPHADAAGARP